MSTNSTSAESFQFASRNAEFGTYDLQAAAELLQSLRRLASSRRKELRRDKLNKLLIDESEEIARSDLLERKVADLRDSISVKNVSYKLLASAQKDSACPTWPRAASSLDLKEVAVYPNEAAPEEDRDEEDQVDARSAEEDEQDADGQVLNVDLLTFKLAYMECVRDYTTAADR